MQDLELSDDLFGSPRPAHLPEWNGELPRHMGKKLTIDEHVNGAKRSKAVNHDGRFRLHWERLGYVLAPCEVRDAYFDGQMTQQGKKHDAFGLFDYIAIKAGEQGVTGIQRCTEGNWCDHLRTMCSVDVETKSKARRVDSLRLWLACGNRAVICYFERRAKVGNQEWWAVVVSVTEEMIAGVEARRRK